MPTCSDIHTFEVYERGKMMFIPDETPPFFV